jgi:hypothetical protein
VNVQGCRSAARATRAGAIVAALLWSTAAHAQLDQRCVVSVLNRTVQVNADGAWVLPSVPANIGKVRARATCVEDGVTRSGQSCFFVIPPNGVVEVPDIVNVSTIARLPSFYEEAGSNVRAKGAA